MAERPVPPPSAQESSPLHEQGGLTLKHWEELLNRLYRQRCSFWDSTIRPYWEIEHYAENVITGGYPDSDLHHRPYLGRRSWKAISALRASSLMQDEIQVKRQYLPFVAKTVPTANPTMVEIVDYADYEAENCYTLNDYMDEHEASRVRWFDLNDQGVWQTRYDVAETVNGPYELFEGGHYFQVTGPHEESHWEWSTVDPKFMKKWLLSDGEFSELVGDKRSISDFDMSEELEKLASRNPDEIRERLKSITPNLVNLHKSPHFGILQKEAPGIMYRYSKMIELGVPPSQEATLKGLIFLKERYPDIVADAETYLTHHDHQDTVTNKLGRADKISNELHRRYCDRGQTSQSEHIVFFEATRLLAHELL